MHTKESRNSLLQKVEKNSKNRRFHTSELDFHYYLVGPHKMTLEQIIDRQNIGNIF